MSEWLIPFEGRNLSGAYQQNFLWKSDYVYIMDNHRAALWCWLQHLSEDEKIQLFHIDRHYDTLNSNLNHWVEICPNVELQTIQEYLGTSCDGDFGCYPLFRWDNYLSIFLSKYSEKVNGTYFATHNEGDEPLFEKIQIIDPWDLPGNFSYWIEQSKQKFIINIDLDYFVYPDAQQKEKRFFSSEYLSELFTNLRIQMDKGNILVVTLCLSPECCGEWDMAEQLCKEACKILNIDFHLPH